MQSVGCAVFIFPVLLNDNYSNLAENNSIFEHADISVFQSLGVTVSCAFWYFTQILRHDSITRRKRQFPSLFTQVHTMADTGAFIIILTGHQSRSTQFSSMHWCKYSFFWLAEGARGSPKVRELAARL
jgi:hypothetical protein